MCRKLLEKSKVPVDSVSRYLVHDEEYIQNVNNEMLHGIIGQYEMFGKTFDIEDGGIVQIETKYKTIVGGSYVDEKGGLEEPDAPVRGDKQEGG